MQRHLFIFIAITILVSACMDPSGSGYPPYVPDRSIPAFPGAEGFGKWTVGGRFGTVHEVTNLNDSGPGSLRAAIEAAGQRIVVFRVSGTIALTHDLKITKPYITIAGQTAPGDGICIKNYPLKLRTHDIVIRYIRCRVGDEASPDTQDALNIKNGTYNIIDHCSASWSTDETLSVTQVDTDYITVQWTIIAESLNGLGHGYGSIIGGNNGNKQPRISFHHNLYAHHNNRSPKFAGEEFSSVGPVIDFRNNVIYNWQDNAGYNSVNQRTNVNYINNYYKPGPSSGNDMIIFRTVTDLARMYVSGNYNSSYPLLADWDLMYVDAVTVMNDPFETETVTTEDASAAYNNVLANVGAVRPQRDPVDTRIINDVINGTTGSIIGSQAEVGGWPVLASDTPPVDSDHDGMPDVWELANSLNPNDPSDSRGDLDDDGYTNIEEYVNSLCE